MKLTPPELKTYYGKLSHPIILSIPLFKFIAIQGKGDPNQEDFPKDVSALYTMTYAVKMSYRHANPPKYYYPYTIFPMEGVWDLVDYSKPSTDKSNFKYTLMIQQPDFLTKELFDAFHERMKVKKPSDALVKVSYVEYNEGLVCQMLHKGSFDNEPKTFAMMESFVNSQGYKRISKLHREIYYSDPRRTAPEKLKTLLRFQIEKIK